MVENMESLDVIEVINLLEQTLDDTNITKKSVRTSYLEVRNLLKPWNLPDLSSDVCIPKCMCSNLPGTSDQALHEQELIKNIENVVENAQKTREDARFKSKRVALAVKQNPSDKARNIYSVSTHTKAARGSNKTSLGEEIHSSSSVTSSLSRSQTSDNSSKKSYSINRAPVLKTKSSSSLQSTYQNDFTPRTSHQPVNKQRKSQSPQFSQKTTSSKPEGYNLSPSRTLTMAQLDDLLNRVSMDSKPVLKSSNVKNGSPDFPKPQPNDACIIHGKGVSSNNPISTWVMFPEAIARLGVPSDLVKALKRYHKFLKCNYQGNCKPKTDKPAVKFMNIVNEMNQNSWSEAMNEPSVALFSDLKTLFNNVIKYKTDILNIQDKFEVLEKRYRKCSNHDASFLLNSTSRSTTAVPQQDTRDENREWAIAGIWNEQSTYHFKALMKMFCIRYNGLPQLMTLTNYIQEIQQEQYQNKMLNLITISILPQLVNTSQDDPGFIPLLKVAMTLCDVKKLMMPIFVKSK